MNKLTNDSFTDNDARLGEQSLFQWSSIREEVNSPKPFSGPLLLKCGN